MRTPLATGRALVPRVGALAAVLLVVACGGDARSSPDAEPVPAAQAVPGVASVPVGVADGVASGADTVGALVDSGAVRAEPMDGDADTATGPTDTRPDSAPAAARFPRPDSLRGLYLNAWTAGSRRRVAQLVTLADTTEVNAFVIDIKDATGYVSHASALPAVTAVGADGERRIVDLPALLDTLDAHGIYPIARIVVVKDPILIAARPDLAVQDTAGGVWVDSKGFVWLDLWNRGVLDYHLALAREVVEMGFPEVQWDYIRFPDAPQADLDRAVFSEADTERREAVRGFLAAARDSLAGMGARSTADVFGVTTSYRIDVGIGQVWESFIDVVDAALPMVYPSHYWVGSFDYDEPNAHPYGVVYEALDDAVQRNLTLAGAGEVVPWLQDFTLGEPDYGAPEVRAQIQATYDAGLTGWVLWNPGSRYTEDALMPATGWRTEPDIRVAREIVPVSRRLEVFEGSRADGVQEDSVAVPSEAVPDSARGSG